MKHKEQVVIRRKKKGSKKTADNNAFTRLTLTLTFLCIVTRMFDASTDICMRLHLLFGVIKSEEMVALFTLIRYLAFFLLIAAHALDGSFYYLYDRNFKQNSFSFKLMTQTVTRTSK